MPPRLGARQMFVTGLALTLVGVALRLFGTELGNLVTSPEGLPPFFALAVVDLLGQITLTLGLVLIGVSPIARLLEEPRKRPDARTVLLRETLDKRLGDRKRRG